MRTRVMAGDRGVAFEHAQHALLRPDAQAIGDLGLLQIHVDEQHGTLALARDAHRQIKRGQVSCHSRAWGTSRREFATFKSIDCRICVRNMSYAFV